MNVSLGSAYAEVFTEPQAGTGGVFNAITCSIQINTAGNYSLVFADQGNDSFGLVIDNVGLSNVPEPASIVLLALPRWPRYDDPEKR